MRPSKNRAPAISLFPFLSILVCMMGVLAFMTVAIALLSATNPVVQLTREQRPDSDGSPGKPEKEPVFVECHGNRMVIHPQGQNVPLEDMLVAAAPFMKLIDRIEANREREYVIFAVFPDGLSCFQEARSVMEQRDLDLGFEPMLAGWRIRDDQPIKGDA